MATQLFKDGQSAWVETSRVQNHLQAGWSPDDPAARTRSYPSTIIPASLGIDKLSAPEQEKAVLKAMGIEDITPLNPAMRPERPAAIQAVQPDEIKAAPKRRGRPPRQ